MRAKKELDLEKKNTDFKKNLNIIVKLVRLLCKDKDFCIYNI